MNKLKRRALVGLVTTIGNRQVLRATCVALAAILATSIGAAPANAKTPTGTQLPSQTSNGWAGSGSGAHTTVQSATITPAFRTAPSGYQRGIDVSSHDHSGCSTCNAPNWPS